MALRRLLVLLLALALLAGACSDDDDDGDDDASDSTTTEVASDETTTTSEPAEEDEGEPATGDAVTIQGFVFGPDSLEVAAGATVTWSNEDGVTHTVTSGTPEEPDGTFEERASSGTSVEVTFGEAGTFTYFCAIHPTMTGEIVVS